MKGISLNLGHRLVGFVDVLMMDANDAVDGVKGSKVKVTTGNDPITL